MKAVIIALVVLLAAGGGGYYYLNSGASQGSDLGKAAPSADAADVTFEWFLTEGELSLGNEEIRAPKGINVILAIDSDAADSIEISGLGVRAALAADSMTPIRFHAYKSGRYQVRLDSTGRAIGSLEIYPGD